MKARPSPARPLVAAALLAGAPTAFPNDDVRGLEHFESRIRPVLIEHCHRCHSAGADSIKGGLLLDSRSGWEQGGDLGPAIRPGDPDASLLIQAIRHSHPTLEMPPKGRLPDAVVQDFEKWVALGAPAPPDPSPDPEDPAPHDSIPPQNHWAFQTIGTPKPPQVRDRHWPNSPIDHFILARLEAASLSPAPPAPPETLVRRVTFDLTGLPPEPDEVRRFTADPSPAAYRALVERLLASPRYGERWGRHWLDVARYADSNGLDENLAYSNAFHYRDYVVRAFNHDVPFDRFLTEQIAGDLVPPDEHEAAGGRPDRIIATGFLAIGPKMLACDDPRKMRLDIVDEQVDTVSRAFMGMTLGCARCHDHKFDPVSTRDYYALAGIFHSTKTMNNFNVVAEWHEREIPNADEREARTRHAARVRDLRTQLESARSNAARAFVDRETAKSDAYREAAQLAVSHPASVSPPGGIPVGGWIDTSQPSPDHVRREAESFNEGTLFVDHESWGQNIGIIAGTGHAEWTFEIQSSGTYQLEFRYAAEEPRPVIVSVDGTDVFQDAAPSVTGGWNPEHQRWEVAGSIPLEAGTHRMRVRRDNGPTPHFDQWLIARIPTPKETPAGSFTDLVRRHDLQHHFLNRWIQAARTHNPPINPFSLPDNPVPLLPPDLRTPVDAARQSLEEAERNPPPLPRAMAVRDLDQPDPLPVHIRGNYLTLGEMTPRGFPEGLGPQSNPPTLPEHTSGRLQLARWLTHPDHPLTARVWVNRVWLWHFGDGLVRTPDNFGRLGEPPTHPDLLDFLARQTLENGWSVKDLHREIVLSATYRMGSHENPVAAAADPENRLRWRFNRRRLDAEEIRDSLLAFGGSLDTSMFGQLLPDRNRAYVTGTGAKAATYDFPRRSLYLPVLRSAVYPVLTAFDFPDPGMLTGQRSRTTVPSQTLFLLNGHLVQEAAEGMSSRIRRLPDDPARVRFILEHAWNRTPRPREIETSLEFIEQYRREQAELDPAAPPATLEDRTWQGFCRAVLASNEFLHLD